FHSPRSHVCKGLEGILRLLISLNSALNVPSSAISSFSKRYRHYGNLLHRRHEAPFVLRAPLQKTHNLLTLSLKILLNINISKLCYSSCKIPSILLTKKNIR